MQTKFTWEGFENREFCVDFKNDADKMHFLKECEKRGYVGCNSGRKPTEMTDCESVERSKTNFNDKIGLLLDQIDLPHITYKRHAIDCSIAENYIKESNRMCKSHNSMCKGCPIENTWKEVGSCRQWNMENPQQSIEIVQAWSDEHPIEPVVTRQDKFLEQYPNAVLDRGILTVLPCSMGTNEKCKENLCPQCRKEYWSQPWEDKHE